ncbi:metalloregulator ArsR/SmtB family transcription factor [Pectinatus frisingensis]|jgi:ArsR family transcriptional regulator|nr:metalloregulator ArsR/SmtB family transcription factor [Pectinatus frisingensis]
MSNEQTNKDCDMCDIYHVHQDMVNKSKLHLLDNATTVRLSETFKLLGDPTRIKILTILSNDEMCVCDIAATLQMGQSAISHQLRLLRSARLVKFRREGKEAWYSLDDNHVVVLLNQGLQHILHN